MASSTMGCRPTERYTFNFHRTCLRKVPHAPHIAASSALKVYKLLIGLEIKRNQNEIEFTRAKEGDWGRSDMPYT